MSRANPRARLAARVKVPQAVPINPAGSLRFHANGLLIASAVVAVAGVYWGVLAHRFVNFDDPMFLYENGHVAAGWSAAGWRWAWTNKDAVLWQPLTWLAHMTVSEFGGMKPAAHLATNVLLHLGNVLLLSAVVRQATADRWIGWGVALLFAVHPANVEAVAWAAQLKTPLSTSLLLVAMLAYLRRRGGGGGSRGPETAAFLLSLLAKPMAVALPVGLVLLDRFSLRPGGGVPPEGTWRGAIRDKWPLGCAAALVLVMNLLPWVRPAAADVASVAGVPPGDRLVAAPWNYVRHLARWAWPVDLAVHYPREAVPPVRAAGAALTLAALTAVAWAARRRRPAVLAGWVWFLLQLLPASGLVRPGQHDVADRYLYVAGMGLALAVVGTVGGAASRRGRWLAAGLLAVLVAGWGGWARRQVGYWRDSLALWERAAEVTPPNALLHLNLGNALLEAGRLGEAQAQLAAAAVLQPGNPRAHVNLAVIAQRRGELKAACDGYQRALALRPDDARVMSNLGSLLADLGDTGRGREWLERAIRIRPDLAEARINLGVLEAQAGEFERARASFEAAARLRPGDAAIRHNLDLLRRQQGGAPAAPAPRS